MTDEAAIRPAEPHEHQQLSELALRSKAYWGYSPAFMTACRVELSVSTADIVHPDRSCWLAEIGGELVGYYALERLSSTEYELEALFVEPDFIGRGVGRQLIDHAKAIAQARGAKSILIQGDPHAARFYEAVGAIRIGERESGSIPGRFLPEFRLTLPSEPAT